jgi:hypothetical protein
VKVLVLPGDPDLLFDGPADASWTVALTQGAGAAGFTPLTHGAKPVVLGSGPRPADGRASGRQFVRRRGRGKMDRRSVRLTVGAGPVTLKEPRMRMVIVPAAAVQVVGLAQALVAERPGKGLAALEKKLLGAWKGQTGCVGNFLFRADGTYELTGYGPAPHDSAGTRKVRWDALPPTLVLTCKTAQIPDQVGEATEVKLTNWTTRASPSSTRTRMAAHLGTTRG